MLPFIRVALLALFTGVGALLQSQAPPSDPPSPKVVSVEIGRVRMNSEWVGSYEIQNQGELPIRIYQIMVSCGCVSATVTNRPIPPADTAEIEIRINTEGRSGRLKEEVHLITDSKETPEIILLVSGDLIPAFTWSTAFVEFKDLTPGQQVQKSVEATAEDGKPLQLLPINPKPLQVKVTPGAPALVTFGLYESELPAGESNGVFQQQFDVVGHPDLKGAMRVFWSRKPRFKVDPALVLVPSDSVVGSSRIRLDQLLGLPFRVLTVEASDERLRVEVVDQRGAQATIRVSWSSRMESGVTYTLRIRTTDPVLPLVQVPFRFTSIP